MVILGICCREAGWFETVVLHKMIEGRVYWAEAASTWQSLEAHWLQALSATYLNDTSMCHRFLCFASE